MTPLEYYQDQCQKGLIVEDPQQLAVLQVFQRIYFELILENKKRSSFFSFLHQPRLVKGLYVWGGVGIGKTFMMDCFFQTLPIEKKIRMHFHQFMQFVHNELTLYQGKKDPLQIVADDLAQKALVLCFDELFVSDITDAMLLGRLFKALFQRGVCLVTTSNSAPDDLYKNGLQRSQFLPAIAALKQHTEVFHVLTLVDYRLRYLREAGLFYTPLNAAAEQSMEKTFATLTQGQQVERAPIVIFDRQIKIVKQAGDVIWFEFADICSVPRSQKDYLAIAEKYRTVFISHIPAISAEAKDQICLFISLIDVFYDAKVRVVISAAEPVSEIYQRGHMIMEYTRTHSRLLEMQSVEYFAGEFGRGNH